MSAKLAEVTRLTANRNCRIGPSIRLSSHATVPKVIRRHLGTFDGSLNSAHLITGNRWGSLTRSQAQPSSESASTSSGVQNFKDAEPIPVRNAEGTLATFPDVPAVYGVYNAAGELQYIGLSRKVSQTVAGYAKDLPDLTHSVKYTAPPTASREQLIEVWKSWMQEAFQETGQVPPGNDRNNQTWATKRKVKPEIKLTPGKGLQDLNCSMADLVDQVVKNVKVVAFVKGTRTQPQCGFSYKVLSMLNEVEADYEVLNVLDEQYNPTLRDVIKEYSQWPTIPQLYVDGEFVGGADILEEMHNKGELKKLVKG